MTLFDLIVLGVLALSGLVGFVRGAVREVVTAGAFILAALAAVFGLRFTAPLARGAVDPDWAAVPVAVVVTFLVLYIVLRILGGSLTRRVQSSSLGTADRTLGIGVGLLRGLLAVGVLHLVLHAVTPADRIPSWMEDAATYPLTSATAAALRVVAGEGSEAAGRYGPTIRRAVQEAADEPPQSDSARGNPDEGAPAYESGEREQLDILVEEAR